MKKYHCLPQLNYLSTSFICSFMQQIFIECSVCYIDINAIHLHSYSSIVYKSIFRALGAEYWVTMESKTSAY